MQELLELRSLVQREGDDAALGAREPEGVVGAGVGRVVQSRAIADAEQVPNARVLEHDLVVGHAVRVQRARIVGGHRLRCKRRRRRRRLRLRNRWIRHARRALGFANQRTVAGLRLGARWRLRALLWLGTQSSEPRTGPAGRTFRFDAHGRNMREFVRLRTRKLSRQCPVGRVVHRQVPHQDQGREPGGEQQQVCLPHRPCLLRASLPTGIQHPRLRSEKQQSPRNDCATAISLTAAPRQTLSCQIRRAHC